MLSSSDLWFFPSCPSPDSCSRSGNTGDFLPQSFHKAILEVDEAGAQAAAATGGFITFMSAQHNRRVLRFNRPFLVVIFSTNTQSILFLGKVVNPMNS